MLTERKEFGMISLLFDGQIQVRVDTVIERDGVEISRTYWRRVLEPGMFTSSTENEPLMQEPRIRQMVEIFWTPDVVATFQKARAELVERNARGEPPVAQDRMEREKR